MHDEGKEEYSNMDQDNVPSIYDVYAESKRKLLFVVSCIGFLSTFDEIVYLPALPTMERDFHTTETLGLATISVYLFALGVSSMMWGILADYFGRRPIMLVGLGGLVLSSVACFFSPSIYFFLVFRSLQGCFVSVTVVVTQAIIADIYHPNDRGQAFGVFYAFYFAGALMAPTTGGQLSSIFGWRSTLVLVSVITSLLLTVFIMIVPETQQCKVISLREAQEKVRFIESETVSKPKFTNPCLQLTYLADPAILPYIVLLTCGFLTVNCGLLILSTQLGKPPYLYPENLIGTLFIPIAVAFFFGSLLGGKASDRIYIKYFQHSKTEQGRVLPGLIFSLLTVVGLVAYGWTLQYRTNVSLIILSQVLCSIGQSATRPGILSYITIKYQDHAASISSANNFLQQILTSIVFAFTSEITKRIQEGAFFTTLATFNLVSTLIVGGVIFMKIRALQNPEKKLLL